MISLSFFFFFNPLIIPPWIITGEEGRKEICNAELMSNLKIKIF